MLKISDLPIILAAKHSTSKFLKNSKILQNFNFYIFLAANRSTCIHSHTLNLRIFKNLNFINTLRLFLNYIYTFGLIPIKSCANSGLQNSILFLLLKHLYIERLRPKIHFLRLTFLVKYNTQCHNSGHINQNFLKLLISYTRYINFRWLKHNFRLRFHQNFNPFV